MRLLKIIVFPDSCVFSTVLLSASALLKLDVRFFNSWTIGYKKLRIDGSLLRSDDKSIVHESSGSEGSEKISRLTGKEGNEKETTPVSAIRSNEPPPKKNEKKTNLKTRIGE